MCKKIRLTFVVFTVFLFSLDYAVPNESVHFDKEYVEYVNETISEYSWIGFYRDGRRKCTETVTSRHGHECHGDGEISCVEQIVETVEAVNEMVCPSGVAW